jgi:23S rRNA-/tRNA-specific pseudouridylate synthase
MASCAAFVQSNRRFQSIGGRDRWREEQPPLPFGALTPRRSAAAERHDPPLVVRRFVTDEALCLGALLEEVARRLAGTPASAERAFWHGGIHVNRRPLDPEAEPESVAAGAWVAVYAFEREPELAAGPPLCVLYDGDGLVAVDKPAWLPMQRTRASARGSLEAALRAQLGDPDLVAAHRLDRQTSGVALFARGRAGAWAARELAARRVRKRYLAVAAPPPAREAFDLEGWIARAPDPARFRFALYAEEPAPPASGVGLPRRPSRRHGVGRWSRTRFRVLARGAERALLVAEPETGRTHQIRVHLASAGAPVVGDDLYGPPFAPDAASAAERVLLHAAALELCRADGSLLRIEAAPPADLCAPLR